MACCMFTSKKKKPAPKAPEPEPKAPAPAPPSAAAPKPPPQPPQEVAHPNGPRAPCIGGSGAYMEELERMSRVPGIRNLEVTTSKTFRWNFRDPVDGRDYEYCHQNQGPTMTYWDSMHRPLAALPPRSPEHGHVGAPTVYRYPRADYYPDEHDCVVM